VTIGRSPTFGDLLRRYRAAAGLTQEELAGKAGLSAKGISDLERGSRLRPRRDTVQLLVDALGLSDRERAILEAAAHQRQVAEETGEDRGFTAGQARGMAPLVGRSNELRQIEGQLHGETSASLLVLLAGEPGIGKSRLLHEASIRATEEGWTVLAGGCHRRSGQEPFAPFLDLFERHLARQPAAERRLHLRGCAWLVRLLPELAETLAPPDYAHGAPPEQERRLMFGAVARYLANVAGPSGTLLALDDLQWAGQDALDLLASLLRSATHDRRLRVIGAYRDTEVRAQQSLGMLLADLAREDLVTHMTLAPLESTESAELLRLLLTDATVGQTEFEQTEFRERLLQRTGGVPFFLVSYVQALRSGALSATESGRGGDIRADLPWTVAETIRQRIAIVPPASRQLLEIVAVNGRGVSRSALMAVATLVGLSEGAILGALDEACRARLLVEVGAADYAFPHDLVRETVLTDVSRAQQALLHRQIAEVLELGPVQPAVEMLAHHYAQAGVHEKAALYLERAGDRAHDRFANAEAQRLYFEAGAHLDAVGLIDEATRVREKWALALLTQARYDEALVALQQIADSYRAARDIEGLGRVTAQIGWAYSQQGNIDLGVTRLVTLFDSPEISSLTSHTKAELSIALSQLYYASERFANALAAADTAVEHAQDASDSHLLGRAQLERGTASYRLGDVEPARRALEAALPALEATGDLWSLGRALHHLGDLQRQIMGDHAQAHRTYERWRDLADRLGDPVQVALACGALGSAGFLQGRWDEAHQHLERAAALVRQASPSLISVDLLCRLAMLLVAEGRRDLAARYAEDAFAMVASTGEEDSMRMLHLALAEQDLVDGQAVSARDRLTPLLDQRRGRAVSSLVRPLLAWAYLDADNEAQAMSLLKETLADARMSHEHYTLVDTLRVHAMALTRQKRWRAAATAFEEDIELAHGMSYPYGEAKALYCYGQLHRDMREPELARKRLEAALDILHRLGERLYAEHIERALGIRPSAATGRG
jgi:tetratricopeptide (TPR) repeat protein/transcriptional regulator with XRE-family HTH domain